MTHSAKAKPKPQLILSLATPADAQEMAELGIKAHKEGTFSVFSYSVKKVTQFITELCQDPNALVLVARDSQANRQVIGYFIGYVSELFFSYDKAGNDLTFYIMPEYRGNYLAIKIIKWFTKWCQENDCAVCALSNGAGAGKRVSKFYQAMGFTLAGYEYRR